MEKLTYKQKIKFMKQLDKFGFQDNYDNKKPTGSIISSDFTCLLQSKKQEITDIFQDFEPIENNKLGKVVDSNLKVKYDDFKLKLIIDLFSIFEQPLILTVDESSVLVIENEYLKCYLAPFGE